jgi:hypothetical protein
LAEIGLRTSSLDIICSQSQSDIISESDVHASPVDKFNIVDSGILQVENGDRRAGDFSGLNSAFNVETLPRRIISNKMDRNKSCFMFTHLISVED